MNVLRLRIAPDTERRVNELATKENVSIEDMGISLLQKGLRETVSRPLLSFLGALGYALFLAVVITVALSITLSENLIAPRLDLTKLIASLFDFLSSVA